MSDPVKQALDDARVLLVELSQIAEAFRPAAHEGQTMRIPAAMGLRMCEVMHDIVARFEVALEASQHASTD